MRKQITERSLGSEILRFFRFANPLLLAFIAGMAWYQLQGGFWWGNAIFVVAVLCQLRLTND